MASSIFQKILRLLEVVSEAKDPPTFTQIVDATNFNKSTAHRLLSICIEERVLRYDANRKTYFLGTRIYDLVRSAYSTHDIQNIALDEMLKLSARFDANITLGIPSGIEVVYLRVLESKTPLGGLQRPGMREPIHCSASGKAILGFLPDAEIDAKLSAYDFKTFTQRTAGDADAFKQELSFVRRHGYGKNDREQYDHLIGISAPIFNSFSEPIAVLNIWSAFPRNTIDELMTWSDDLLQAADSVSGLIGGHKPSLAT